MTLMSPADPINHSCSLTGKWILENCFTYLSVQIFKILFPEILFSRIWSSAQDYALRCLLLNPVVLLISAWQKSVRRKWCVLAVYQFWKGISAGPALKYFTWFIGAGGLVCVYDITFSHTRTINTCILSSIQSELKCIAILLRGEYTSLPQPKPPRHRICFRCHNHCHHQFCCFGSAAFEAFRFIVEQLSSIQQKTKTSYNRQ